MKGIYDIANYFSMIGVASLGIFLAIDQHLISFTSSRETGYVLGVVAITLFIIVSLIVIAELIVTGKISRTLPTLVFLLSAFLIVAFPSF